MTLSRDARARALQLPAWNEAMGLPRPWDQQWSLRIQQVLANETDLLEYPDIFEGSVVMDGLVEELCEGTRAEMAVVEEHGGAVKAVPYMKSRLVESHRERVARIESGELKVVGQNSFTESEDSPLTAGADGGILTPDPEVERERVEALEKWKAERDEEAALAALAELGRVAADDGQNIMPATIAAAKAGATTGEWAEVLREAFGAYRGPTGVSGAAPATDREQLEAIRAKVDDVSAQIGHRIKILVGKPGLDGHSNGSEQIALRARDAGMEVIYQGIRLTPEEIAESALQEDVDVVGLSILSGSHLELIPEVVRLLEAEEVRVPVVVGGIIPVADAERLRAAGVDGVYTPKDFDINKIMGEIVDLVAVKRAPPPRPDRRRPNHIVNRLARELLIATRSAALRAQGRQDRPPDRPLQRCHPRRGLLPAGSLKARLCWRRARALRVLRTARRSPTSGKLIVATEQPELSRARRVGAARRGQRGARPDGT